MHSFGLSRSDIEQVTKLSTTKMEFDTNLALGYHYALSRLRKQNSNHSATAVAQTYPKMTKPGRACLERIKGYAKEY